jgi:UDP-N-acetylglucosamine transferase subunit ALG13
MIFLTVGTQLPFERLIKCVDQLCEQHRSLKVVGQIGNCSYTPKHFEYHNTLSIQDFNKLFLSADHIISHAGMGSILTALSNNKPILMMPRKAQFEEHRNDHQLGTAKNFADKDGCYVFNDLIELDHHYTNVINNKLLLSSVSKYAPVETINHLKEIITSV